MSTAQSSLNLAVIGNCQVAALIDTYGRMVWACLPRPDGDPVFCSLLASPRVDGQRGIFAVDMMNCVDQRQAYLRNTAVLTTQLLDAAGDGVLVTDFCPRFRSGGRMFRPMQFVRLVEPLRGRPQIRIRLKPCVQYGRPAPEPSPGSHHLRLEAAEVRYRVTTDASLSAVLEEKSFRLDAPIAFLIGPDETLLETPLAVARSLLAETRRYWQDWVRTLALPFEWQSAVIRAAITLKLSTFEDSGAVLAALTTSVPEAPDSGRNWDYRYCWLRDSYFVIQALNRLGATRTMEGYLQYISNIVFNTPVREVQPVYGIAGETALEERVVPALDGYRGMGPVRTGNLAYAQRQNDVYGALVLATSQLFFDARLAAPGDRALFTRLEHLGESAAAAYDRPDAGPWELRGRAEVHSYSAAMCWAACDRLARIARQLHLQERAAVWRARAATIKATALAGSWNSSLGYFASSFGGSRLDATLCLWPDIGFVPATDPRFLTTLDAIGRELRAGDLLYRYREDDDFGKPRFAFTACSFWYANALAAAGRLAEARSVFESVLARRNGAGLLSEHVDPVTGEQWGNFPQTYCMVGIISGAVRLSRSWEEAM